MSTPSDAANAAVRAVLRRLSGTLGRWAEEEKQATIDYFNGCCAYSDTPFERGENGAYIGVQWDHATPENKEHCGLTLKGNMFPVTKTENANKGGDTSFEEYLANRPEKLARVKAFRQDSNYPEVNAEELKEKLNLLYAIVTATVDAAIRQCLSDGENPQPQRGRTAKRLRAELNQFIENHERWPSTNATDADERSLANCCSSKVSKLQKRNDNTPDDTALIERWKNK